MLALPACCLAALALLAAASGRCSDASQLPVYRAETTKGLNVEKRWEYTHLYIPDGQCSAYIDHSLTLCPVGMLALSVSAVDHQLPVVKVASSLLEAQVWRQRSPLTARCDGAANVTLKTYCKPHNVHIQGLVAPDLMPQSFMMLPSLSPQGFEAEALMPQPLEPIEPHRLNEVFEP